MRQTESLIRFIKILLVLWLAMCAFKAFAQRIIHVRHQTYEILYNQDLLTPECVYYTLRASDFSGSVTKKPKHFKMDYLLPPPHRKNKDFTFSGYQRGHLCPSGDRDSRKDWFKDTFFTSNIVPMTAEVNGGTWRDIENVCRQMALKGHTLKVVAIALCDSTLESNTFQGGIYIPTHFAKIVKCTTCDTISQAWIIPNVRYRVSHPECNTQADLVYSKMTPIVAQFIKLWINQ